jgi:molybdate transport repressor ModE-like protein
MLLKSIDEKGTLKEASQSLEMSYRYAWGLIREAEERLREPLIEASKGGRDGGGSTEITALGREFIEDFETLRNSLVQVSMDSAAISTNQVTGIISNIKYTQEEVILSIQMDEVEARFGKRDIELHKGDEVKLRLILE